jgi:hypothetical protein
MAQGKLVKMKSRRELGEEDIARAAGIVARASKRTVSRVPAVSASFEQWAADRIQELTAETLKLYLSVLTGKDEDGNPVDVNMRMKLDVAHLVLLELSGLRAPMRVESKSVTMSMEDIEEFKRRGMELLAKHNNSVIALEAPE